MKKFVFNSLLLIDSFDELERKGIPVGLGNRVAPVSSIEESDFSPKIRYNAGKMSAVYIGFFCLENSVRELIGDRMAERKGYDWWGKCVPDKIKKYVMGLIEKEKANRYHTQRSVSPIGYTTFAHLSQIIVYNWEDFSDLFPDQSWITARFHDLEMSRNIIMHSGILPEIEIERIQSIVRDWIRQVG